MNAHTPAPWFARELERGRMSVSAPRTDHLTSHSIWSIVSHVSGPKDQRRANAHLIAAAPDMLAALRECASRCRYDGDHHSDLGLESRRDASWEAMRMAERAIAKAEGVANPYPEIENQPLTSTDTTGD